MRLRHRHRFWPSLAAGVAAGLAALAALPHGHAIAFLLGFDVFFATYLALLIRLLVVHEGFARERDGPAQEDDGPAQEDEGLGIILTVTALIIVGSLMVIFVLLRRSDGALRDFLIVASVPLGWVVLHTLVAFHYANLYYAAPAADPGATALDFPRTPAPGAWDFLYFSFVIGMTAQVSDVAVRSTPMRRAVLVHGVGSFFYNAVIVALFVNAYAR
jgi:uncharacterized membrane protein